MCSICEHPDRRGIEEHLLAFSYGNDGMSLKDIAEKFKVELQDLQIHCMMHTMLVTLEANSNSKDSLVSDMKKREASVLEQVADEYRITLQQCGKRVREMLRDETGGRLITKDLVELYLGTGNNIRQTMQAIVEMNAKLTAEDSNGMNGLVDVMKAIRRGPDKGVVKVS